MKPREKKKKKGYPNSFLKNRSWLRLLDSALYWSYQRFSRVFDVYKDNNLVAVKIFKPIRVPLKCINYQRRLKSWNLVIVSDFAKWFDGFKKII